MPLRKNFFDSFESWSSLADQALTRWNWATAREAGLNWLSCDSGGSVYLLRLKRPCAVQGLTNPIKAVFPEKLYLGLNLNNSKFQAQRAGCGSVEAMTCCTAWNMRDSHLQLLQISIILSQIFSSCYISANIPFIFKYKYCWTSALLICIAGTLL